MFSEVVPLPDIPAYFLAILVLHPFSSGFAIVKPGKIIVDNPMWKHIWAGKNGAEKHDKQYGGE